jgi:hypothetical protein
MSNFYVILFNKIFDSGVMHSQWAFGNIIPLYKNKGDSVDPNNYRPITLISCLGKLFTSILNNRLNQYADAAQLILENQAGFRKTYSTLDHIFTLYTLIEMSKYHRKKVILCF